MNDTSSQPPYGAAPPPPPPPPAGGPQPGPAGGPAPQPGQPGQPGPGDPRHGLTRFFDAIRGIGLVRSQHRVVGGVCGGIAERTGIDPTVVRVVAVVLGIFGGIGVLLYGLAWLLLPEPDGRIHGEQVLHGKVDAGAVGAIVVTVLALGGGPGAGWRHWGPGIGWHGGVFGLLWGLTGSAVVIAVIVLAVYLAVRGRGNRSGGTGFGPGSGPGYGPGYGPTGYQPGGYGPTTPATTPAQPTGPPMSAGPMPPFGPEPSAPTSGSSTASGAPPAPSAATNPPMYGGTATLTVAAPPSVPPHLQPIPAGPTGPSPSRRRPSLGLFAPLVGGLALVGAGVSALVTHNGHHRVGTAAMAWAVALGVIALALVVGGLLGRRSGVVTVFALVALVGTLVTAVIPKAAHLQTVGEHTWRPATTAAASGGYAVGIGHGVLDLSAMGPAALDSDNPRTISVSVGIGQLTLEVPPWMSVVIHTHVGAGSLPSPDPSLGGTSTDNVSDGRSFAGRDDNGDLGGARLKRTLTIGTGSPGLIVDANVGVGEIDVEQVSR